MWEYRNMDIAGWLLIVLFVVIAARLAVGEDTDHDFRDE